LSSFEISITITRKNMTSKTLKFEDFEVEKLTKKQQKTVRGGDEAQCIVDPTKGGTIGNGGTP
jgi:hypothetical protein